MSGRALLAWLCCSTPAAALLLRPASVAALAQPRMAPRACSGGAVMLDSSLVAQLPTTAIADGGNPLFSEVFLAGASIALASVVATVFVGILVRGNYDDLEASFFEAQDDSLEVRKCLSNGQHVPSPCRPTVDLSRAPNPDPSVTLNPNQESAERDSRAENTDAARDFFGDSNVREAAPPPTPTVQSESGEK